MKQGVKERTVDFSAGVVSPGARSKLNLTTRNWATDIVTETSRPG